MFLRKVGFFLAVTSLILPHVAVAKNIDKVLADFQRDLSAFQADTCYSRLAGKSSYRLKSRPSNLDLVNFSKQSLNQGFPYLTVLNEAGDVQGGQVLLQGLYVVKMFQNRPADKSAPVLNAREAYYCGREESGAVAADANLMQNYVASLRAKNLNEYVFLQAMTIVIDQAKFENKPWNEFFAFFEGGFDLLLNNGLHQQKAARLFQTPYLVATCLDDQQRIDDLVSKYGSRVDKGALANFQATLANSDLRNKMCLSQGLHIN